MSAFFASSMNAVAPPFKTISSKRAVIHFWPNRAERRAFAGSQLRQFSLGSRSSSNWRHTPVQRPYKNDTFREQAIGFALLTAIAAAGLVEETDTSKEWGCIAFFQSHRKINCQCENAATAAAVAVTSHRHSLQEEESERHFHEKGYTLLEYPSRFSPTHAIAGNLLEPGLVERYKLYKLPNIDKHRALDNETENNLSDLLGKEVVIADICFGDRINGHDGIIHGGIAGLFFDDVFGFGCYEVMRALNEGVVRRAFTANLSIDFRRPLPQNSRVIVRVKLISVERRKIMMQAVLEDFDGSVTYSDATALYLMEREPI